MSTDQQPGSAVVEEETRAVEEPVLCGLYGCILSRTHSGLCQVAPQLGQRSRRAVPQYDAEWGKELNAKLRAAAAARERARPPKPKRPRATPAPTEGGASTLAAAHATPPDASASDRGAVREEPPPLQALTLNAGAAEGATRLLDVQQKQMRAVQLGPTLDRIGQEQPELGDAAPASVSESQEAGSRATEMAPPQQTTGVADVAASEGAAAEATAEPTAPAAPAAPAAPTAPTAPTASAPRKMSRPAKRPRVEPRPCGGRSGTRSHGQPVWALVEWDLPEPPSDGGPGGSGASLGSGTQQARQLAMLRDFLPKGRDDRAANSTWASKETEKYDALNASRGIAWGCQCQGHIASGMGGVEMLCKGCGLYFHSKCERLSQSGEELQLLLARHGYECMQCEEARLKGLGFENGKFAFQCRFCGRTFDDERSATTHGQKCASLQLRRQWACACNGTRGNSAALQCASCSGWFHRSCKRDKRAAWDRPEQRADLCSACDAASPEAPSNGRVARRAHLAAAQEQQLEEFLLPAHEEQEAGNLADGRVCVRASGLGRGAGLGLFAGVPYERGDVITTYSGPLLYREQIADDADTSYILRLPNSGGRHIDGKPFADAIRANPANPDADGRHFPLEGAAEWRAGAASMANDPRQVALYNSRITFRKPQGASKALCELAPMRAILIATRDVAQHEEIFFNYGSAKPFEHLKKEAQREEREKREKEQRRNVCNLAWVPNA